MITLYQSRTDYVGNDTYFIPNILSRYEKTGEIIATKNSKWGERWGIELKEACENNCKVYIKSICTYEPDKTFESFIRYLYSERLKNKEANIALANFQKLIMNSTYGKTGQQIKLKCRLCENQYDIEKIYSNRNYKVEEFDLLGDDFVLIKYYDIRDKNNSVGNLVRFASYITAVGRTNLSKFMRVVGHQNVWYCDTDSVYTDQDPPKEFLDQDELGKWKIETKKVKVGDKKYSVPLLISDAEFLAPKTYFYKVDEEILKQKGLTQSDGINFKAKGIPNKLLKEDYYKKAINGEEVKVKND
ncbi:MAG TPA: DNA polymerase, partial [Candidatus Sulfopaludibacter sp.]|nr:DNA polymerase [Candidatus Sulfopaludibacter sp.]